jgi:DNA polymerase III subunit alpha
MTNFISLHNQTQYSILDSLVDVKALFKRAKELGQTAIAITEHGSLGSVWESWKASQATGVKLIIGCECYFQNDASHVEDKFRHIILLAKNAVGYRNLLTINKKGFDQTSFVGKRVYSVIDWKLLEQYSEGLICLTACGNGIISQLLMQHKTNETEDTLLRLKKIFGDNLGIEVQPNNMKRGSNIFNDEIDQFFLNRQLINLGKKHDIRVVAACNTHYLTKEEAETHDVFLAIGSHQPIYSNFRLRYTVPDFYLKTGDEVKAFFSRNYGDEIAQQLCDNSIYFADLCEKPEWIDPKFSNPSGKELPIFPVKDEPDYIEFCEWKEGQSEDIKKLAEDSAYLRFKSFQEFNKRLIHQIKPEQHDEYIKRIETELSVLDYQGFSSYMLIVGDYVNWAKNNGVPTGPGRGSGSGSMVGYLLNIHEADPIKYGLIFERFQTKTKISSPDYDLDFGAKDRYKVVNYVINKYGKDNVANISNYNTITPKVYARDMARTCEFGGSKEEAVKIGTLIADIIPGEIRNKAGLEAIPLYFEHAKRYPELIKHSDILGKIRNLSTHAAAIVISGRPLVGLYPLRRDKDGALSLECEKNTAEEVGFVKMDFLGLSTLDIIEQCKILIKEAGKELPIINYDDNDEKTYELITKGDTYGVFQFGTSGGTIDLCKKIKPKNINDLSIITTLARPAASDIRKDFISAREGKTTNTLLHPSLAGAFEKTYGFGLFDESILRLGADVAGWDLNEADRLRKMIKDKGKYPDKDKKLREEFIEGAIKNKGIRREIAVLIWDNEIKKFGGYTFNMGHATTYSMISYHTAFLKAHYPIEFLMANLMAEVKSASDDARGNIDKIKGELKKHHVKVISPDINKSQLAYTIEEGNKLITGLDAIKFVGDDAIIDIIKKRPFSNFFDFMARVTSKAVRANSIQALAACGALDSFKLPRRSMFLYCSDYRKKLQIWLKKHDPIKDQFVYPWPVEPDWSVQELYALEQFYLGESFICKPAAAYGNFFKSDHATVYDIKKSKNKSNINSVKGIVTNFFEFRVKKETSKFYGKPMVKAVIEDKNGATITLTIFSDKWDIVKERVKEINKKAVFSVGMALHFSGNTNVYEDDIGIILNDLFDIALPPALPDDLKAKKINLKEAKAKIFNKEELKKPSSVQEIEDQMEDSLYDEGLIDLDEDNENENLNFD